MKTENKSNKSKKIKKNLIIKYFCHKIVKFINNHIL